MDSETIKTIVTGIFLALPIILVVLLLIIVTSIEVEESKCSRCGSKDFYKTEFKRWGAYDWYKMVYTKRCLHCNKFITRSAPTEYDPDYSIAKRNRDAKILQEEKGFR